MAKLQQRFMVGRLLGHVRELAAVRHGLRAEQLAERAGISRATAYRDIQQLMASQIPIQATTVNGETRYSLDWDVPPLQLTPVQLGALVMLRRMVEPLRGTQVVKELDGLIKQFAKKHAAPVPVAVDGVGPRSAAPQVLAALDHACSLGLCVRMLYQSATAEQEAWRVVEPRELRMHHGQVYFTAWDQKSADWRVFKPSRIKAFDPPKAKAPKRPEYDADELFANAIGVWNAPAVDVVVWIDKAGAAFVQEYPLAEGQVVTQHKDGSATVRAKVAGTKEALHWVLNWGRKARVLEPASFAGEVRSELEAALGRYGG
jgi:predicted DNA-binding transcriptional regulator YafY